jgi:uncharacterized RDD family membrane protein YckC
MSSIHCAAQKQHLSRYEPSRRAKGEVLMQYQIEYVGVWRRAVAVVLDLIIIGSLTSPIWFNSGLFTMTTRTTTTGEVVPQVIQFAASPWAGLLAGAIPFVYFMLLEGFFGATAGKLLVGLRVVKLDGTPIGWREAVVRNLLRPIDQILLYLVAAIAVWASPRRQRLGDRAADTVVVRRVPVTAPAYAPMGVPTQQPMTGPVPPQTPTPSHN